MELFVEMSKEGGGNDVFTRGQYTTESDEDEVWVGESVAGLLFLTFEEGATRRSVRGADAS